MNITSVIFDLNGTILSDEDEYGLAFKNILKKVGIDVAGDYPHERGIGVYANWEKFIRNYDIRSDYSISELSFLTQKEYLALAPQATLTRGFVDFIQSLKHKGRKTALATSNNKVVTMQVLQRFDIGKYFDVVTTGDEVKDNKPDPEIYILTAKKLTSEPHECIVFEDSEAGIVSAQSAGMRVFKIGNTGTTDVTTFADFTQVKLEDIIVL